MKKQTILLTVFTLLVVLAFIYFIFINNQSSSIEGSLNTASISESVLTSTTTTGGIEISSSTTNSIQGSAPRSFKVYEDKNFGISFKYPSDWGTSKSVGGGDFLPAVFIEGNGQKISIVKNFDKAPVTGLNTRSEEYKTYNGQTVRVWEDYENGNLTSIDARITTCKSIGIFANGIVDGKVGIIDKEVIKEIIRSINCF